MPAEVAAYRRRLVALVVTRAGEAAKDIPPPNAEPWMQSRALPETLVQYSASVGLEPPTLEQWNALSPLRRFTLLKLTRDNHDNINFVPAMREFGLL
jgi:hypothetical protein